LLILLTDKVSAAGVLARTSAEEIRGVHDRANEETRGIMPPAVALRVALHVISIIRGTLRHEVSKLFWGENRSLVGKLLYGSGSLRISCAPDWSHRSFRLPEPSVLL